MISMENSPNFQGKKNHYLRLAICLIACFACGILDGYTLMFKGFFGMLQTGNLVSAAMYLILGQFEYLMIYVPVIISFMIGLFVCDVIEDITNKKEKHSPFIFSIMALVILLIIIFIPSSFEIASNKIDHHKFDYNNIISNCLFAVLGAIMYRTFFKFDATSFSSAMMTANLSRFSHSFYQGVVKKNKEERIKAIDYVLIILCFLLGVVVYGLFHEFYLLKIFSNQKVFSILPNLILIVPFVLISVTIFLNHFSAKEIKKENRNKIIE